MDNTKKTISTSKEDRRESIILSGLKVFCEKGYESTTVDDIVIKAGCSHGLFYHYFKSKKEIFDEVMKKHNKITFEQIEEKLNSQISYREKLELLVNGMYDNLVHDENSSYYFFFFLMQCFNYSKSGKALINKEKEKSTKTLPHLVEELFLEGQKNGEFSDKYSPKECTSLFLAIIQGSSLKYAISPKELDVTPNLPKAQLILDIFSKGDAR